MSEVADQAGGEVADLDRLVEVAARLAAAGVGPARAEARWLTEHARAVAPSPAQVPAVLEDLVRRRESREPIQLIVGHWPFRTVELAVAPGVFLPRPETEVVAQLAIDAARAVVARRGAARVVEPCTGTGAIALSLLVEVPSVSVIAADVDPTAVALATANLTRVRDGSAGVRPARGATASVVHSDLLAAVDPAWRGHLDVLVANPPYLPAADRGSFPPEVASYDPDRALVGGEDGHEVVDALLVLAAEWLRPGGTVVLEIDERRGADVRAAAARAGLTAVRVVCDLTGADRAVVAERPDLV